MMNCRLVRILVIIGSYKDGEGKIGRETEEAKATEKVEGGGKEGKVGRRR